MSESNDARQPSRQKAWTPAVSRRQALTGGLVFATVMAVGLGAGAYALDGDLTLALAAFAGILVASFAGVLLAVRIIEWYEHLMNRPWGSGRGTDPAAEAE